MRTKNSEHALLVLLVGIVLIIPESCNPEYSTNRVYPPLELGEPFEFSDSRDSNTYRAYKIGEQTWMKENLAYLPSCSPSSEESDTALLYYVYAYEGTNVSSAKNEDNYNQYGVLYNWKAALVSCPYGWHLPIDQGGKILELFCGMQTYDVDNDGWRRTHDVGHQLIYDEYYGYNRSGFNGLFAGMRRLNGKRGIGDYEGGFYGLHSNANFWTISPCDSLNSWVREIWSSAEGAVYRDPQNIKYGFSVRCIKDE